MRLIEKGIPDVLQPCPIFSGGISEVQKIAALAASMDIPVVYHGFLGAYGYHMAMADMNTRLGECMFFDEEDPAVRPSFLTDGPVPRDGTIRLGEQPGFGLAFDIPSQPDSAYGHAESL
jgi:L-alanine-DL-glutamate epimerase-like enolase superfamily enzyme